MKGGNQSLHPVSSLAHKTGTWTITIGWMLCESLYLSGHLNDPSPCEVEQWSDWLVNNAWPPLVHCSLLISPLLPPLPLPLTLLFPLPHPIRISSPAPSLLSLSLPPSFLAISKRGSQVLDQTTRRIIRSTDPSHVLQFRLVSNRYFYSCLAPVSVNFSVGPKPIQQKGNHLPKIPPPSVCLKGACPQPTVGKFPW